MRTPHQRDFRLPARLAPRLLGAALALSVTLAGLVFFLLPGGGEDHQAQAERETASAEPASVSGEHPAARERGVRAAADRGARPLPRVVTLIVRGAVDRVETHADTVAELLTQARVDLGDDDRVHPEPGTALASGMEVVVQRVVTETESSTEELAHDTVERETDERERGERVTVRDGKDGSVVTVTEIVLVDGVEETRRDVEEDVTDPVSRIVEVGTAAPQPEPEPEPEAEPEAEPEPEPASTPASSGGGDQGTWDRLAQCESNGDWSINTGNGYYGGLQFHSQTWAAHGGRQYAPNAHQASKSEQIAVAKSVQASQGWGAWPACSRKLGLG